MTFLLIGILVATILAYFLFVKDGKPKTAPIAVSPKDRKTRQSKHYWGRELRVPEPNTACGIARELNGCCYKLGNIPSLPLQGCDAYWCDCFHVDLCERRSGKERRSGQERRDQIRFEARQDRRSGKDRRSKEKYDWHFTV